ncbi:YitT family protein [Paenibacillus roseipurpureus]|uniref:YitT family protein n=1 Tax=Paenibacillus roseopurpureus TaxID=2918901 RepID=A0AA96RKV1_9BACL|nr:YitT family protein [Paenibacillus sp. MBLB1832]WNR44706.1 YitT family protein [Paenibacillus sp. MBLB1832]
MSRREPRLRIGSPAHTAFEYVLMLVGSLIMAASFNSFLNPNQIATGGVSGISTILQEVTGLKPAYTQWALNIPILLLAIWLVGKKFGVKAVVGSIIFPFCVLATSHLGVPTHNPLLAAVYGGIGVGLGLGIVFKGRGSTGGLGLAAQILHKYSGLSLGFSVAIFDGVVIISSALVFTPENALYGMIGLFVTTKTIDIVQIGFNYAKVAFIISDHTDAIRKAILYDLDRGLTELSGAGGFTGESRTVMMVVVKQNEVSRLKTLVQAVDPQAFVILSETNEVLGEGFKRHA